MPVIQHRHQVPGSPVEIVVYPLKPTRSAAPEEVCTAAPDLATDYNEAVACEPHSSQAAVLLLGRCLSQILIDKCDAPKPGTLGRQIDHAVKEGKLPEKVAKAIDTFKTGRNQAAHPWYDESGGHLKVDAETVEWSFVVIETLFERFYVTPAREEKQSNKMAAAWKKKKAGDKS